MGNKPTTGIPLTDKGGDLPNKPHEDFLYERNVCALSYWEPIKLLGEGSISDIHLVVRRKEPIHVRYKEKRDVMALAKKKKKKGPNDNDDDAKIADKDLYALKSIMKDHVRDDRFLEEMRREIYTMSRLRHRNIVTLLEAYERRRHIYLVMEFCSGGDLTDRKFSEPLCAGITAQILSALAYMHHYGVVHRDIKLENICFAKDPESGEWVPKIIDFGLATKFLSEEYKNMTDKVGTLYSMAPQVLQGVYDSKCDLWSMGVVTYCLLSGYKPFWGPPRSMPWKERRKIMMDRIMRCEYMSMNSGPAWSKVSKEAKDFVASMLQLDPSQRPSAQEALDSSPWIQKYHGNEDGDGNSCLAQEVKAASDSNAEHQVHLVIRDQARDLLVAGLTESQLMALQEAVEQKDDLGTGCVQIQNVRAILVEQLDKSDTTGTLVEDLDKLLRDNKIGTLDSSPCIEYIDFFARALEEKGRQAMDGIAKACDDLDVHGTRTVPLDALECVLMHYFPGKPGEKLRIQVAAKSTKETGADGKEQEVVSTIYVLELAARTVAKRTRDSIRSGGLDEDDDGDNLATADNTQIPGGKTSFDMEPRFVYDAGQKSLRKAS